MLNYIELIRVLADYFSKYYYAKEATFLKKVSAHWYRLIARRPMSERFDRNAYQQLLQRIHELNVADYDDASKLFLLASKMLDILHEVAASDPYCWSDKAKFVRETLIRHYDINRDLAYHLDYRKRFCLDIPDALIGAPTFLGWTGFLELIEQAHEAASQPFELEKLGIKLHKHIAPAVVKTPQFAV